MTQSALFGEYFSFSRDLDNLFVEAGRRSHVIWRLDGSFGGLRAVSKEIVNPPGGGTEGIWAEPLRLADFVHFHLWDAAEGQDSVERNAKTYTRQVGYSEIEYRFGSRPGLAALKTIWVPLDLPAVVVELALRNELDRDMALRLFADFQSHLSIGWPLREGGRNTAAFDRGLPGIVAHDEGHPAWTAVCAASRAPEAVHVGSFTSVLIGTGGLADPAGGSGEPGRGRSCMQYSLTVPAEGEFRLTVVVSGSPSSESEAREAARAILDDPVKHRDRKVGHYRRIFEESAVLESPSYVFNKAFLWAKLGTEDFKHEDPRLGFLFFAGFPAYNFYFAGDTMLILRASLAIGDFEDSARMLRTIVRYQARQAGRDVLPGEIWHEMSTTGDRISPNFAGFLFPGLLRAFHDWTGDRALLEEMYPAARAVVEWGYLMDRNGDDLLENRPEGEMADSASEDRNVERSHFHVQVQWLDALREGAHLATLVGDTKSAGRWAATAERVHSLVNRMYWNEAHRYFEETLRPDGCLDTSGKGLTNLDPGMVDEGKAVATARLLLEEESYITDIASFRERKAFEQAFSTHRAYMSWYVIERGRRALQLYRAHFPGPAFAALEAVAASPFHWTTPGLWPEVWAVDEPHALRVRGCFHQAWTGSHGFIHPLVDGMLGLKPDAEGHSLTLAPHLPPEWPGLALRRLRLGTARLDVECTQAEGSRRLAVHNDGDAALRVTFGFILPHAARLTGMRVNGRAQDPSTLRMRTTHADIHAFVDATAEPGRVCFAELTWQPGEITLGIGAAHGVFLARAEPGTRVSLMVQIRNTGHAPASVELSVDAPPGWQVSRRPGRTITVQGDEVKSEPLVLEVPADAAEGYYTIRAWLSGATGHRAGCVVYQPVFPAFTAAVDARQVARPGVLFTVRADAVNLGASSRDIEASVTWPSDWTSASAAGSMKGVTAGTGATLDFAATPAGAGDAAIRVTFRSAGHEALREHPVRVVPRDRRLVLFSGFLGCPVPSDDTLEVVSMPANYALRRPHVLDDLLPQADLILTSDQHDAVFPPAQVDAMIGFVENGGRLLLYCCWSAPWGRGFFDTFGSIAGSRLPEILPLKMRKGITHARRVRVTEPGRAVFGGIAWDTIPAFDHNDCEAREGARVLATSGEGAPVIAEWSVGRGRVMAISIDCFGFESYVEGLSFDFWPGKPQMLGAAVRALLA
jgi:hypothetical protein